MAGPSAAGRKPAHSVHPEGTGGAPGLPPGVLSLGERRGAHRRHLDHPSTTATVASLRAEAGSAAGRLGMWRTGSRLRHASERFEFYSERAAAAGFRAPVYDGLPASPYPLVFRQGRTLTKFQRLLRPWPRAADTRRSTPSPALDLPVDAAARGLADGAAIRVYNERGSSEPAPSHRSDSCALSGCATDGKGELAHRGDRAYRTGPSTMSPSAPVKRPFDANGRRAATEK